MGIGINIAGTGIGLTQTIMNRKNKQAGQYDEVSGRVTHCTLHWFDDTQGNEAVMSTSLAGGGSLTVYKPTDFNQTRNILRKHGTVGNVTEEEVSLNKVDPSMPRMFKWRHIQLMRQNRSLYRMQTDCFWRQRKSFVSAWIIFMIKWILHRL